MEAHLICEHTVAVQDSSTPFQYCDSCTCISEVFTYVEQKSDKASLSSSVIICGICMEPVTTGQRALIPCLHHFCKTYISKWSQTSDTCPECRINLAQRVRVQEQTSNRYTGEYLEMYFNSSSSVEENKFDFHLPQRVNSGHDFYDIPSRAVRSERQRHSFPNYSSTEARSRPVARSRVKRGKSRPLCLALVKTGLRKGQPCVNRIGRSFEQACGIHS